MTSKSVNRTLLPRTVREKSTDEKNQHDDEIKQKQRISQQLKQKYIQDLQQRNRKLKNQIKKITQILQQNDEKQQQKIKQRQKNMGKNYKSIVSRNSQQSNPELLKKQLQNVYKQIKNYQREIQKVENNRVGSKNSSDQISRLQTIRHEKMEHLQKLNNQLSGLFNLQAVNEKKLKNNMGREHYESQIIKVGDQLKVLKEKLRGVEEKEKKKVVNAKKQLEYIKKLETQLLEGGVAMDEIEELKKKNIYIQIKNIMNKEKDEQREDEPAENVNGNFGQAEQDVVTFQKLQQMKNEIKLYKKLHQDYEKRLVIIQKEKETADIKIVEKKQQIQESNVTIEKLNSEIDEVKHLVRKNNVVSNQTIPGNLESIRKLQNKKGAEGSRQISKDNDERKGTKMAAQKRTKLQA